MRRVFLVLGLMVLGLTTALGVLWWSFLWAPLPSDAHVRSRFQTHRAAFDSLAAMARADTLLVGAGAPPLSDVYVRNTAHHDRRLSEAEVASTGRSAYARLLLQAGVPSLSRSRYESAVIFLVGKNQKGSKGILYSEDEIEPLLPTLDRPEAYGHVALAPRWYLFVSPGD